MKNKKGFIFGALLLLVVGVFFMKEKNKETNLEKAGASKTKIVEEKELKLGVLQLLSHPALDEIYRGLIEELVRQGYEDGKTLKLDFQNAQGDQSNLALMTEKLVEGKNDILVGITTPATLALANATKETPIIMGGISYPVESGLIADENKPGNNVTGVLHRTAAKKQIELIKDVLPNLKKLGVLYTSSEDNAIKQVEEAKVAAKEMGLELKISAVASTNDVQQVTESLASEVDAIYVPIDNTIASTMATVSKIADEFKIAVFVSSESMVADGGTMALGINQYQIGVKTAEMVVAVVNGAVPAETAVVSPDEGVIYINSEKIKQLGIVVPANILEKSKEAVKK